MSVIQSFINHKNCHDEEKKIGQKIKIDEISMLFSSNFSIQRIMRILKIILNRKENPFLKENIKARILEKINENHSKFLQLLISFSSLEILKEYENMNFENQNFLLQLCPKIQEYIFSKTMRKQQNELSKTNHQLENLKKNIENTEKAQLLTINSQLSNLQASISNLKNTELSSIHNEISNLKKCISNLEIMTTVPDYFVSRFKFLYCRIIQYVYEKHYENKVDYSFGDFKSNVKQATSVIGCISSDTYYFVIGEIGNNQLFIGRSNIVPIGFYYKQEEISTSNPFSGHYIYGISYLDQNDCDQIISPSITRYFHIHESNHTYFDGGNFVIIQGHLINA